MWGLRHPQNSDSKQLPEWLGLAVEHIGTEQAKVGRVVAMNDVIYSVGIDLGTSTTQMVISKLTMKNLAAAFSIPRIEIIDKEVMFRSEIIFTPLVAQNLIDMEPIKKFLDEQYEKSGFCRDQIQVGAVIITGETARKENSQLVLEALSSYAGEFVVATAGPDLESIIAGFGAGAQAYSKKHHQVVVNLDIGGGTTNVVVFKDGELVDTACYDIGGRLIKVNKTTKVIEYISPKLAEIIKQEDLSIKVGVVATSGLLMPIINILVDSLAYAVGLGKKPKYIDLLMTHKHLKNRDNLSCISFSGGVADCIHLEADRDEFAYGDIGILLGQKVKDSQLMREKMVVAGAETIRATVVGAGSHTTQVSGSTITYINETLPLKNIPVLKLTKADENQSEDVLAQIITEKLSWYQPEGEDQVVALGLDGFKNPSFEEIINLAKAIRAGYAKEIAKGCPLIILLREDNGKSLGQAILRMVPKGQAVISLDGVAVESGDYVDIGMPVAGGAVLPVIVKTLVFER